MNGDVMPKALLTEVNNGLFWNRLNLILKMIQPWENDLPNVFNAAILLSHQASALPMID
jgi:hypothetical protein